MKKKTLMECAFGDGARGEVARLVSDIETWGIDGGEAPLEVWAALGKVMFKNRNLRINEALENKKTNKGNIHPVDKLGIRVIVIHSKLCDVLDDVVGKPRLRSKPRIFPTIRQWVQELAKHKIVGDDRDAGTPSDRYARSLADKYGLKLGSSPRGKPSHLDR